MSKKQPKGNNNYALLKDEAGDILLKRIVELEQTLVKAKTAPKPNQQAIDFYKSVLDAMKLAWWYISETQWIYRKLNMIQLENDFLKEYAGNIRDQLEEYQAIERSKLRGDFDEMVEQVDAHINRFKEFEN